MDAGWGDGDGLVLVVLLFEFEVVMMIHFSTVKPDFQITFYTHLKWISHALYIICGSLACGN